MTWTALAEVAGALLAQSDHLLELADAVIDFARKLGAAPADLEQQIAKARQGRARALARAAAKDWPGESDVAGLAAREIGEANR